jgi:hypothetical protein
VVAVEVGMLQRLEEQVVEVIQSQAHTKQQEMIEDLVLMAVKILVAVEVQQNGVDLA